MKRTSTLIKNGIVLSLLTSTLLHATNGDNMIAVGTKARGMGGTGIAISQGAESTLSNPAMITAVEGTEISFGGILFMPNIQSGFDNAPLSTSDADTNIVPEVSIVHQINENWSIGAGMYGTAGMGVDYSNAGQMPATMGGGNVNMHMVTNLQLLQFAVPVAYKTNGFSIAVAPILQYGNLDINYEGALDASNMFGPGVMADVGSSAGLAQDFGWGWTVGASYDFKDAGVEGLTLGAVYKSSIKMTYEHQLTNAMADFVNFGIFKPGQISDTLEQPEEYGVGVSYTIQGHSIAFDYKKINWSSAEGYGDFGWEDQDVYAFGYQFAQDNWAVRAGYNYASAAASEQANGNTNPQAAALNFFNLLAFPATAEQHYTMGGTYQLTDAFGIDLAYVYSPENETTYDISAFKGFGARNPGSITTTHEENSVSVQLTYNF